MVSHPPGNRRLVLIPGIQGRWEWMRPAIDALAATHDVLTFSLQEVRQTPHFAHWHDRIDRFLHDGNMKPLPIVGVSFGGLIAASYAASRPALVSHLILVSTPSPRWSPDGRSIRYLRHPRLSAPFFAARAVSRLGPEIVRALPTWPTRAAFFASYVGRTLRWPASPTDMAAWAREWQESDMLSACRGIDAPTLIVTGEADLDRVVPVSSSLDYLTLIRGARHMRIARTGHIGLVLRPDAFARIVTGFVDRRPP